MLLVTLSLLLPAYSVVQNNNERVEIVPDAAAVVQVSASGVISKDDIAVVATLDAMATNNSRSGRAQVFTP